MLSVSPKGDSPVTSASAGAANPGHRHSDPPNRPKPAILIVDDVLENRMVLEMFLTRHGFDVALAESGEEAIRLTKHRAFEAILMDIHMPKMDGYAATRQIRRHERSGQRALILAVTAAIGGDVRAKCLDAGMDEHFAKPLNLVTFCRTLSQLIAARTDAR